ncbi:hypothetical protein BC829DRAFT_386004 [Chytridium lagenaria]|nr:hypothetical protein BC829DRAFT_386004 [Chytridium lagenaria]
MASAAQCFTLTGSTQMPDFNGAAILSSPNTFNDTTSLDTYLTQNLDSNTAYQNSFKDFFDCPNWNGTGQRFHMTYFQGLIAFFSTQSATACQPTNVVRNICQDSCDIARTSLSAIFNNTAFCSSQDPEQRRSQTLEAYTRFCRRLPTINCIPAVRLESGSCGFPISSDAANYCRSGGAGAAINDQCCLALQGDAATAANAAGIAVIPFAPGAVIANGTVLTAGPTGVNLPATAGPGASTTAASVNSGSGQSSNNRSIIIGAVVAAITAALILGSIAVFIFSRHRKRNAANARGYQSASAALDPPPKKKGLFSRKRDRSDTQSSNSSRLNRSPSYIPYNATASAENTGKSQSYIDRSLPPSTQTNNAPYFPSEQPQGSLFSGLLNDQSFNERGVENRRSSLQPSPVLNDPRMSQAPSEMGNRSAYTSSALYSVNGSASNNGMFKMQVIYDYTAAMPDELSLEPGDILTVTALFDDGWGHGILGENRGAFPLACVAPLDNSIPGGSKDARLSILNRRSSLYSTANANRPGGNGGGL